MEVEIPAWTNEELVKKLATHLHENHCKWPEPTTKLGMLVCSMVGVGLCRWKEENKNLEDPWKGTSHQTWLKRAVEILKSMPSIFEANKICMRIEDYRNLRNYLKRWGII